MINLNETKSKRFTFYHSPEAKLHFTPGIWVKGKYFWLQNCQEKIMYEEQVLIKVKQDHLHSKIHFNHIYVSNHSKQTTRIKLLAMHHHSRISPDQFTFASPKDQVIFHYANKEVFMVNGQCQSQGIKEYTIQPYWNVFTDKIWDSLEKGNLRYQPMAKGAAASIFTLEAEIKPHETVQLNTWMIKGESKRELMALNQALLKNTLAFRFEK